MRVVLPGLLAALALAGCSKPADSPAADANGAATVAADASAAAPATGDACSVLTQADAAKALGRNVTKLDADGGAAALEICQYGYQGERLMDSGHVSLIYHPNSLAQMRQGLEAEKATIEEVPGIGDGAVYTSGFGLYVGKNGRTGVYMLGAGGMNPADTKARLIALAKATVSRL